MIIVVVIVLVLNVVNSPFFFTKKLCHFYLGAPEELTSTTQKSQEPQELQEDKFVQYMQFCLILPSNPTLISLKEKNSTTTKKERPRHEQLLLWF